MQRCHGITKFGVDDCTLFSLLIASAAHDVDHPGHNNMFEMKNKSVLSVIYNDKSVLENHHCATLFKIASCKEAAIFDGLSKD